MYFIAPLKQRNSSFFSVQHPLRLSGQGVCLSSIFNVHTSWSMNKIPHRYERRTHSLPQISLTSRVSGILLRYFQILRFFKEIFQGKSWFSRTCTGTPHNFMIKRLIFLRPTSKVRQFWDKYICALCPPTQNGPDENKPQRSLKLSKYLLILQLRKIIW